MGLLPVGCPEIVPQAEPCTPETENAAEGSSRDLQSYFGKRRRGLS